MALPNWAGDAVASTGSHLVQISNSSHNTTVKTTPYSLSAISGSSGVAGTPQLIQVTLQAAVGNGGVQAWSTHCAPALGGSDPNFNPTSPAYFSGTGCQATGNAVALSGTVSHAQLCIGENGSDTVVKEYFAPTGPGAVGTASVPLSALFDSTHFKGGAKIKITLKVWDTSGGYYDAKVEALAYNKARILTNNSLPSFDAERKAIFGSLPSGYSSTSTSGSNDASTSILNNLAFNSVFYIHTHANPNNFGDCNYDGGGDVVSFTGINSVASVVNAGNTSNSTVPPYNFVFINGCNSAGSYDPYGRFLPGTGATGFGIQGKDRAFLGTQDFTPTSDYRWSETIWNFLSVGAPLYDAVILTQLFQPLTGSQYEANWPPTHSVYPRIAGDGKMRLTGIYPLHSSNINVKTLTIPWFIPL